MNTSPTPTLEVELQKENSITYNTSKVRPKHSPKTPRCLGLANYRGELRQIHCDSTKRRQLYWKASGHPQMTRIDDVTFEDLTFKRLDKEVARELFAPREEA